MKRVFDIVLAVALGLIAAPLIIGVAVAILVFSRGPVLFRHRRMGRGGRSFDCLKFRTMVVDAEEWLARDEGLRAEHRNGGFKLPLERDPRVTAVGRIIRRAQLDELPQLWNVLVGDMSLVGPRPLVEEELCWYPGDAETRLLSVRPGILGPWTAMGRRRPGYPERAEIDLGYASGSSLSRDLALIVAHFPVLLQGQAEN